MSPTEAAKEAFRAVYQAYQGATRVLAAAQKDLMGAMAANAEIFRSSRADAGADGVEDWDADKARRAAAGMDNLARHYDLVSRALANQAAALREVTTAATMIINAIGPEECTAEGSP